MSIFTDLRESLFPRKEKYNTQELRAGMAEYVAATYQPAPKKSAEKHPQSATPIPKKPGAGKRERPAKPAKQPAAQATDGSPEGAAFSARLLALMKERKIRGARVCKRAGLDKKLFSQLADEGAAPPPKDTVIALALALECSPEEAKDLLECAGYTLTCSSRRDVMIEYLFREKIYDLPTAKALLEQMKQKPAGAKTEQKTGER